MVEMTWCDGRLDGVCSRPWPWPWPWPWPDKTPTCLRHRSSGSARLGSPRRRCSSAMWMWTSVPSSAAHLVLVMSLGSFQSVSRPCVQRVGGQTYAEQSLGLSRRGSDRRQYTDHVTSLHVTSRHFTSLHCTALHDARPLGSVLRLTVSLAREVPVRRAGRELVTASPLSAALH